MRELVTLSCVQNLQGFFFDVPLSPFVNSNGLSWHRGGVLSCMSLYNKSVKNYLSLYYLTLIDFSPLSIVCTWVAIYILSPLLYHMAWGVEYLWFCLFNSSIFNISFRVSSVSPFILYFWLQAIFIQGGFTSYIQDYSLLILGGTCM